MEESKVSKDKTDTIPDFKESEIYKLGKFYHEFGSMMMDKNTGLSELTEKANSYGLQIRIQFADSPRKK